MPERGSLAQETCLATARQKHACAVAHVVATCMGVWSCVDAVGRSVAAAEIRLRTGRNRGRKRRAAGGVSGVCLISGVTAGIRTDMLGDASESWIAVIGVGRESLPRGPFRRGGGYR